MVKWGLFICLLPLFLISCSNDESDELPPCENCLYFKDPQGDERIFTVYSKELSASGVLIGVNYNTPNTQLKLYFSESQTSIVGLNLYVDVPYDFQRSYTSTGEAIVYPDGSLGGTKNKVLFTFWDGGNTSPYVHLCSSAHFTVSEYSYSASVYDEHILKGTFSQVTFNSWDTIPSFGTDTATLENVKINIKY